ncbi:MAG: hypothetical protein Q9207_003028 [Kuettlingeria erythrocarpa]
MASSVKSELRARTHDISRISYHIQDVETFGHLGNKAAGGGAFRNKRRFRYRNVYVLLLSWEADELGVISEVQELDDVFTQTYRFQTEQWRIPNGSARPRENPQFPAIPLGCDGSRAVVTFVEVGLSASKV